MKKLIALSAIVISIVVLGVVLYATRSVHLHGQMRGYVHLAGEVEGDDGWGFLHIFGF